MRKIKYNSQRNNVSFPGVPAYAQCFYTSAFMFISYFRNDIKGDDDTMLSKYVDDIEPSIGSPGIGERIVQKYKYITGRVGAWFIAHQEALQSWLPGKHIVFNEHFPIEQLLDVVKISPIIIGTNRLPNIPGGHIILLVDFDYDKRSWVVNDPWGNATKGYFAWDGENVLYPYDWLLKYIDYGNCKARVIYAL